MPTAVSASIAADDLDEVQVGGGIGTNTGDRAELTEVAEDSAIWPLVTSTADNCLGRRVSRSTQDCHVVKRPQSAAQEAELVVVNHHLPAGRSRDEGIEGLRRVSAWCGRDHPGRSAPDSGSRCAQFFGISAWHSGDRAPVVDELEVRDAYRFPGMQRCKNCSRRQTADGSASAARGSAAGGGAPRTQRRHRPISANAARRPCHMPRMTRELLWRYRRVDGILGRASRNSTSSCFSIIERLGHPRQRRQPGTDCAGSTSIRAAYGCNLTPLDVARHAERALQTADHQACDFYVGDACRLARTSAHFSSERAGLKRRRPGLTFPSPLQRSIGQWTRSGCRRGCPSRRTGITTRDANAGARWCRLLDATAGGMFCLFTSHRARSIMRRSGSRSTRAYSARASCWSRVMRRATICCAVFANMVMPCCSVRVVSGKASTCAGRRSVLSRSTSCRFASPADPLMMARLEFIRREGGNGFMDHQLPLAALSLKQGQGACCVTKPTLASLSCATRASRANAMAASFLNALAPMPRPDRLNDVAAFFAGAAKNQGEVA